MTPERYQQIEHLFHQALRHDPESRAQYLFEACAEDAELRLEVESLIDAHEKAKTFMAGLASELVPTIPPEDKTQPLPNRQFGRFKVNRLIGVGGMGEVYAAEDTRLHRPVALKLLPARFTADPDRVRRFEQEALAASALNHPNIVTIYDIGETKDGSFIAMEFIEGQTLRALAESPLSIQELTQISEQIAEALSVAHSAGIIHRDIKPDNIMVRTDGYVKVLDFGLARLSGGDFPLAPQSDGKSDTHSGAIMGTIRYMSPEQARGEKVTAASDLFSFGIVLYELATGQHPFSAQSQLEFLNAIIGQQAIAPSNLNPEISQNLEALILGLLEKDARLRPTAAGAASALSEKNSGGVEPVIAAVTAPVKIERRTVGRESERAALRSAVAAIATGRGSMVCVTGEPGMGKTTLVEEFLAELAHDSQPVKVARGRCSERLAGTEAYLPFLEVLDNLMRNDSGGATTQAIKRLAPTWYAQIMPILSESSAANLTENRAPSQERLKRELVSLFQEIAKRQLLALFFDDLHWADISTVDLLNFLASHFEGMRLLIVATYRPSELLLGKHPFLKVKLDLQGRGLCRELPLEFLNLTEIEHYLELLFPNHLFPADFAELIYAKTEGNPLFIADLLRYLRDHQFITERVINETAARWELAQAIPEIERELPESVRGMVERKIAQISESDRKTLTAASVQGNEFDSAVVAKALGMEAADVEESLESLERIHAFVRLVDEREFPDRTFTLRYRFVHVLYQNALYGSLRPTRRASLSAAIAQTLLDCYGERVSEVASRLALLLEAARDFSRASDYFLLAAQNASALYAYHEAVKLARRGVESLKMLPDSPERLRKELSLQMILGTSVVATAGYTSREAEQSYSRAHELCRQIDDPGLLMKILFGLWTVYVIRSDFRNAKQIVEQIMPMALAGQSRNLLMRAYFAKAFTSDYMGDHLAARDNYEQVLRLYDPAKDRQSKHIYGHESKVNSLSRLAWVNWVLGYPDKAKQLIEECDVLTRSVPHPFSRTSAMLSAPLVYEELHDSAKAQQLAEETMRISSEHNFPLNYVFAGLHRAIAVARQSRMEEGLAEFNDHLSKMRKIGAGHQSGYLNLLAIALLEAGRFREGLAAVTEAITNSESVEENYFQAEHYRVKGDLLVKVAKSDPLPDSDAATPDDQQSIFKEAEACFQLAIEIARRKEARSHELRATMSLCRLWSEQGKKEQARKLLAEIYDWFTEGFETPDLKKARALLDQLS